MNSTEFPVVLLKDRHKWHYAEKHFHVLNRYTSSNVSQVQRTTALNQSMITVLTKAMLTFCIRSTTACQKLFLHFFAMPIMHTVVILDNILLFYDDPTPS
jgi:hypothetical protein